MRHWKVQGTVARIPKVCQENDQQLSSAASRVTYTSPPIVRYWKTSMPNYFATPMNIRSRPKLPSADAANARHASTNLTAQTQIEIPKTKVLQLSERVLRPNGTTQSN